MFDWDVELFTLVVFEPGTIDLELAAGSLPDPMFETDFGYPLIYEA